MLAIPAIDLREGACVQLVGGEYAAERVRRDNPVEVAREWARQGFSRLHVVDLDAATRRGDNRVVIDDILHEGDCVVQVGGGVRDADQIDELLRLGATAVVVGTRALEDPEWLAEMAHRVPGTLIVAADVRERKVVTRGWAKTLPLDVLDAVETLNELPLAALLVTAVHLEGRMQGTDLTLMEDVADASHVPVIASGGIATVQDLRALEHRGLAAAVLGMALYTGALDPRAIADEFSTWT
ncbi:MAG TPA: 1-(5-phosphoribosyl)-5-[(5-phosphoribosylamino)methylideneamino]imidazole-4-carboxamide isomerase, partial [Gemmatimonadaceae bacterium]|nr:1-(5-phosphoribosyl)-5-[(5-phosphoribosylamino)methylideneamino]imidazole-4-carboxamide isomerase [Gemmatimonadaceae bacterium]